MPDLESKISAVQASWVVRIMESNENWSFLGKHHLNIIPDFTVLKFNFNHINSFPILRKLPHFYQDIIGSFNKSKVYPHPCKQEDILNQILWGNRYIRERKAGTSVQATLYFKEWTESKIMYVRDLKFLNGCLDENFLYNKIKDKRNIYVQILTLKKSLECFKEILETHIPAETSINTPAIYQSNGLDFDLSDKKSQFFYQNLIKQKVESPYQENIWRKVFQDLHDINFEKIYISKIKFCPDSKLAEFNYKLLHLILPCLVNLNKWRIVDDIMCPLCFVKHDIIHLLFRCTKAQAVWKSVNSKLNTNLSLFDVVCGCADNPALNFFISVASFCIYKEWLLFYKDVNNWRSNNIVSFVRSNIMSHLDVYKNCKKMSENKLELLECSLL